MVFKMKSGAVNTMAKNRVQKKVFQKNVKMVEESDDDEDDEDLSDDDELDNDDGDLDMNSEDENDDDDDDDLDEEDEMPVASSKNKQMKLASQKVQQKSHQLKANMKGNQQKKQMQKFNPQRNESHSSDDDDDDDEDDDDDDDEEEDNDESDSETFPLSKGNNNKSGKAKNISQQQQLKLKTEKFSPQKQLKVKSENVTPQKNLKLGNDSPHKQKLQKTPLQKNNKTTAAHNKESGDSLLQGKRKTGDRQDMPDPKRIKVAHLSPEEFEIEKRRQQERDKLALFVSQLPPTTTDKDLRALSPDIIEARIPRRKKPGRGGLLYAFLEFVNEEKAVAAHSKLQNKVLGGQKLHVDFVGEKSIRFKETKTEHLTRKTIIRTKLFVGGLPSEVTLSDLTNLFPAAKEIDLLPKKGPKKFAYIRFDDEEITASVFKDSDSLRIGGRTLTVLYATHIQKKKKKGKKRNNKNKQQKKTQDDDADNDLDSEDDDEDDDDE